MINSKEIFSYNKSVYIATYLVATMLTSDPQTPLWAGSLVIAGTLLITSVVGIVIHALGRTLGIATWRYQTFATRTQNGKILSFLSNTTLWVAIAIKSANLVADNCWKQIISLGISPTDVRIAAENSVAVVGVLAIVQTIFVLYMIARKIRLTFFNTKKVQPQT